MLSLGGPTFKKQTKKQTKKNNNTKTLFNLALVRVKFDFVNTKMEKIVYRHWLPAILMSLSHFRLFVFVKQLTKKFKTKTGLFFQVYLKVSNKFCTAILSDLSGSKFHISEAKKFCEWGSWCHMYKSLHTHGSNKKKFQILCPYQINGIS